MLVHALVHQAYWRRIVGYLFVETEQSRVPLFWLAPVLVVPPFYYAFYAFNRAFYGVSIHPQHLWLDVAAQLLLGYVLFAFSRRVTLFLLLEAVAMGIVYSGNAAKISLLGGPITPDEVVALKELWAILNGAKFIYVVAPFAALGGLLVANFRWRQVASPAALAVIAAFVAAIVVFPAAFNRPLDAVYGYYPWNMMRNFKERGASIFFLQELARDVQNRPVAPARKEVAAAVDDDRRAVSLPPDFAKRNIYYVLLESFWDAASLTQARFDADPLHERFRTLWNQGGNNHALTPTFGTATPKSEFELLCGTPHLPSYVAFLHGVTNRLPCLPAMLAEAGYDTIAVHPNAADFWNRHNVYPRLGFTEYLSRKDFDLDDLNGEFLSDESTYRQVWDRLQKGDVARPRFVYIVTLTGHYDYPLNHQRRPTVVHAAQRDSLVERYANTAWYSSKEVIEFTDRILADDPEALILIAGDHLPILGQNFAAYREAGLFEGEADNFDAAMLRTLLSTPLLVIDGRRGPWSLPDDTALFRVTPAVLEHLGVGADLWMNAFAPPFASAEFRPLSGRQPLRAGRPQRGLPRHRGTARPLPMVRAVESAGARPHVRPAACVGVVEAVAVRALGSVANTPKTTRGAAPVRTRRQNAGARAGCCRRRNPTTRRPGPGARRR